MRDADFGYTDPHGIEVLRLALRDYLGRVRGVVTDAGRVVVTSGYSQGRSLLCRALAAMGARRVGVEDPCHDEVRVSGAGAGLELVPVPVDGEGIRVDALERAAVDAVFVTPAHQYPTGAVLSGARRGALLEWLRRREAIAIEDDYDAEYRYDRAPVGALQGMDPERIVYAGTASKTLAPAMRLGWLVVPPRLLEAVQRQQRQVDFGVSRIEQHAFADFLSRGELDRHLRRMRVRYRARRDALVEALVEAAARGAGARDPGGAARHGPAAPGRPGTGDPRRGGAPRRRAHRDERLLPRPGRGFVDAVAGVRADLRGGDPGGGAGAGGRSEGGAGGRQRRSARRMEIAAVQRRTLTLLFVAQIVSGIGMSVGGSVGALLAAEMAGIALSGVAQSANVIGAALFALPAAAIVRHRGRRPSLAAGYVAAALGSLVVVAAAMRGSVALLFAGLFFFGGATAAGYQARYAAVDLAPAALRGRHLSLIVWATTIGAIVGPSLAAPAGAALRRYGIPTLAGPFLLSALLFALSALLLLLLLSPDPAVVARDAAGGTEAPGRTLARSAPARRCRSSRPTSRRGSA